MFAELGEDESKRSFDSFQYAMGESHSADCNAEEVAMITNIAKLTCEANQCQKNE